MLIKISDRYPPMLFGYMPEMAVDCQYVDSLDQEFFVRVSHGAWSFDFIHGNRRKDDPTAAYLS